VRSRRTQEFRALLATLPPVIQEWAREAYRHFQANPYHPSLHFKQIDRGDASIYSARVGARYRAVGLRDGDVIIWFWIGSHADYDKLI